VKRVQERVEHVEQGRRRPAWDPKTGVGPVEGWRAAENAVGLYISRGWGWAGPWSPPRLPTTEGPGGPGLRNAGRVSSRYPPNSRRRGKAPCPSFDRSKTAIRGEDSAGPPLPTHEAALPSPRVSRGRRGDLVEVEDKKTASMDRSDRAVGATLRSTRPRSRAGGGCRPTRRDGHGRNSTPWATKRVEGWLWIQSQEGAKQRQHRGDQVISGTPAA